LLRVFFATDIHGSEICWKKFIAAADFYDAGLLILGGDMTGKALIPIIEEKSGGYVVDFQDNHHVLKNTTDLERIEKIIRNKGYYPTRIERTQFEQLAADPKKMAAWSNATFNGLMASRVKEWMSYADEKLKGSNVRCYVCPGNDDMFEIDEIIVSSSSVSVAEGKVLEVIENHELISSGWSTPTPWKTFRECSEEELGKKIAAMTGKLKNPARSIFNLHDPPISSGLDEAPDLTEDLSLKGAGKVTKAVGSIAVREAIEKVQPMVGLHGHIHESKGIAKLGRTVCINPGSVYEEGTLMGAIVDLEEDKVKRYSVTAG